ncbi:hypothetical protein [Geobacter sp. SVR]|uniref:hypothetical protein n=1 Tax=Geobacter sp. SVR TaxID=2495594 RepID=UPI00143EFB1B|nr:hypothetical protein [Geobacter sp. SVR]BCS55308.1 hypothetical protein GSVR_36160 [Geobacter sp. SVR]GCF87233.1 hypothetical protein GSbR_38330 [Geobacter sp. SVR]
MYLTSDVLLWKPTMSGSFSSGNAIRNKRAYEILVHAETILDSAANDLHLIDCIANLKRAINSRLKTLNEIYNFLRVNPRLCRGTPIV